MGSLKHGEPKALLLQLEEVGSVDPHVAFSFLRQCAGFCKMAHLAHGTPPSQAMSALKAFDLDIRSCFSHCTAVDTSNQAWQQEELSLSRGGLGLRSISRHSPAAYIASLSSSGFSMSSQQHFKQALRMSKEYNITGKSQRYKVIQPMSNYSRARRECTLTSIP